MNERTLPAVSSNAATPAGVVPPSSALPEPARLFRFMRDAEGRFATLRMRILDRAAATGESERSIDVWLRHPGQARVVTGLREDVPRGSYDTWLCTDGVVQRYDARARVVRSRPLARPPDGVEDDALPPFARVYRPRTQLPAGSLADTFVHPHGLCRNVLVTGALSISAAGQLACGRPAIEVRCDHPRSTQVLTDRPDYRIEIAVDRVTGAILRLVERVGDMITRDAEAVTFEPDAPVSDADFELHVSADVRRLF